MKSPEAFLHQRNNHLHHTPEVEQVADYLRQGKERVPNEPVAKIAAYIGFLADKNYANHGLFTGDQAGIDQTVNSHVVKSGEITESYFDLQLRIIREQGFGDVEMTREMREQLTEIVQENQAASLRDWAEYLSSDDANYPAWFTYYTFDSVIKMAEFDLESESFRRRSSGTAAAFPELNAEALSASYDAICKLHINSEEGVFSDEPDLQKIIASANFSKIYSHYFNVARAENREEANTTEGKWTKYNQQTEAEGQTHRALATSLKGKGTSWCTAVESTARYQLRAGDFYVYYTTDKKGAFTNPRIAIRMAHGGVAELRGIEKGQNLETEMYKIAIDKVSGLPGGETYKLKSEDMQAVTEIERKTSAGLPLTAQELYFIYEYDRPIEGFGLRARDPRVRNIVNRRNTTKDLTTMFEFYGYDGLKKRLEARDRLDDLYKSPDAAAQFGISHDDLAKEQLDAGMLDTFFKYIHKYDLQEINPTEIVDQVLGTRLKYNTIVCDSAIAYLFNTAQSPAERIDAFNKVGEYGFLAATLLRPNKLKFNDVELLHIFYLLPRDEIETVVWSNFKLFETLFETRQDFHDALIAKGAAAVILAKAGRQFSTTNIDYEGVASNLIDSSKNADHKQAYSQIISTYKKLVSLTSESTVIDLLMQHNQPQAALSLGVLSQDVRNKLDLTKIKDMLIEANDIETLYIHYKLKDIPNHLHATIVKMQLNQSKSSWDQRRSIEHVIRKVDQFDPSAIDFSYLFDSVTDVYNQDTETVSTLIRHIHKFPGEAVNHTKLANLGMKLGLHKVLAQHIDKFPDGTVDIEELTNVLAENDEDDFILRKLGKQLGGLGLGNALAEKSIREAIRQGEQYVNTNLDRLVVATEPVALAERLIGCGMGYLVEDNIKLFMKAAKDKPAFLDSLDDLGMHHLTERYSSMRHPVENF